MADGLGFASRRPASNAAGRPAPKSRQNLGKSTSPTWSPIQPAIKRTAPLFSTAAIDWAHSYGGISLSTLTIVLICLVLALTLYVRSALDSPVLVIALPIVGVAVEVIVPLRTGCSFHLLVSRKRLLTQ